MTIEERLTRSLADGLALVPLPAGDLPAVQRQGDRIRRTRRIVAGSVVAGLVVAGVVAGLAPWGDERAAQPAPPTGTWEKLAPAPLAGRWSPLTGWTGREALFIGGGIDTPCPPGADCATDDRFAQDGAAYDPDSGTWRTIADAPVPMPYYYRTAMVDDTFVVFGDHRWFAYDAGDDAWRELPGPAAKVQDTGAISAYDGRVHALARDGAVEVLDLATDTWSEVAPSDLRPALAQRTVVATDAGIVVSGVDSTQPNDGHEPSPVLAEVWDGSDWTRLPATGQLSSGWHWTGLRLVDLDLQTADGGEVQGWDRAYPYGGRLDPATGVWTPLPDAPDVDAPRPAGWSVNAADGPLVAGWGYVYDDAAESWTLLGGPRSDVDSDQAGVWADGRLVVFGGVDAETGYRDVSGLSNEAWAWTP